MTPTYVSEERLQKFVADALLEDVGLGDYSSLGAVPAQAVSEAHLIIKDDGVIAGLALAEFIFKAVSSDFEMEFFQKDGDRVANEDLGFHVKGSARSILKAERLVLNCLQRMSGIATYTNHMNSLIKGSGAKLLDTRKTTPNFRMMEKWAVAIGGGVNHRFGLYDMVMLKDNHIDYAGGVSEAIRSTQKYLAENNLSLDIEIEVRNLDALSMKMITFSDGSTESSLKLKVLPEILLSTKMALFGLLVSMKPSQNLT